MVFVIVCVQHLSFNGDLSDWSILFDVLRVSIPHVNREVTEFTRYLELEFFTEKRCQCSFDDRRSANLLLVKSDRTVNVPEGAGRQGMSIEVELLGGGG